MMYRIKKWDDKSSSHISEIHSFLKELKVNLVTKGDSLNLEDLVNTLKMVNEVWIELLEEKSKFQHSDDRKVLEALTIVVELRKMLLAKISSLMAAKQSISMADLMTLVDLLEIINSNLKEAEDEVRSWIKKTMNGIYEPKPPIHLGLNLEKCLDALKVLMSSR